jgi:hypothetical protein
MDWILENPLPSVLIGGLTAAMLGSGWLRTGQKWLLALTIAAILLTVGAVFLERIVVTDREQITVTLHEIADLAERNEIEAALEYAYSGTPEVRDHASAELPQYKFQKIDIKRNLRIEVFPDHIPPKAEATFNVLVVLNTRDGPIRILRYVEVTFFKEEDGQWRVGDYSHYEPRRAFTVDPARRDSR